MSSLHIANPNFPDGLDIRVNANLKRKGHASQNEPDIDQPVDEYGIAGRVWEAADVLIDYFAAGTDATPVCSIFHSQANSKHIESRRIVELGSGTGYVGLKLSELLFEQDERETLVILTDLPDVCPLLEKNLQSLCSRVGNELNTVTKIAPLSWGNHIETLAIFENLMRAPSSYKDDDVHEEIHPLSHIVCSDLVYFPSLLAPLLRTLLHLTSPPFCTENNSPEVIIGYRVRSLSKETAFWTAFGLWFEYEPVLQLVKPPNERSDPKWRLFEQSSESEDLTLVFVAHRRKDSMDWVVPGDDQDLLDGVGAQGTPSHKGDDYFERLLLMQLDIGD
ncbi:hypothetical protein SCHPADRAFT_168515 [Schizopora paradoxa]|uniref:S-adenosyl-L-methionine-dependent methyltransferase n=1 Tax=Schizopora paradoxa TaxID=27342 RepID=A0A0H2SK29_9AGAM|nr:hypothetical protein SCHPADRAFT_168515 [Schizopora paradoxa]